MSPSSGLVMPMIGPLARRRRFEVGGVRFFRACRSPPAAACRDGRARTARTARRARPAGPSPRSVRSAHPSDRAQCVAQFASASLERLSVCLTALPAFSSAASTSPDLMLLLASLHASDGGVEMRIGGGDILDRREQPSAGRLGRRADLGVVFGSRRRRRSSGDRAATENRRRIPPSEKCRPRSARSLRSASARRSPRRSSENRAARRRPSWWRRAVSPLRRGTALRPRFRAPRLRRLRAETS